MIARERVLQLLGLDPGLGAGRTVRIAAGQTGAVLSSRDAAASMIPPEPIRLPDLATLRQLVNGDRRAPQAGAAALAPWSAGEDAAAWDKLGAASTRKLRDALVATAFGDAPAGHFDSAIARHFFPMPGTVFAARDVTVAAGTTLYIEPDGHDPVVCTFDTLTLEDGGLIKVGAPAIVSVGTLRKTAA